MAGKENREIKNSVFVDLFYEDESAEANEIALFNAIHDEPLPEGTKIRGHEFHYYDSSDNGEDCMAVKPVTGKSYPCVIETQNRFLGFPHLYYPSNPGFAENFVEKARDFRNRNQNRNQNRNWDRKR